MVAQEIAIPRPTDSKGSTTSSEAPVTASPGTGAGAAVHDDPDCWSASTAVPPNEFTNRPAATQAPTEGQDTSASSTCWCASASLGWGAIWPLHWPPVSVSMRPAEPPAVE